MILKIIIAIVLILIGLYVGIGYKMIDTDESCCMPYGTQTKCFYGCEVDQRNISWKFKNNTCYCSDGKIIT